MTRETDIAFLEDYEFMLVTGESHDTAAIRFGCTPNTLQRRVERTRLRLREADSVSEFAGVSGKIVSTTETAPACGGTHVDPGPNHRIGVA